MRTTDKQTPPADEGPRAFVRTSAAFALAVLGQVPVFQRRRL